MGREQVTNGGWQSLERQETSPRGGCCGLHFLAPEAHSMTPPDPRDGHRREEEQLGGGGSAVPQLASSLLSWQSLSPSQMKAGLVQMPVEH